MPLIEEALSSVRYGSVGFPIKEDMMMGFAIEDHAAAIGAGLEPTRSVFDLAQENRHVLDALVSLSPQLPNALESVRKNIPLMKSATPGIQHRFYRLPSHNRSFCYSLDDAASPAESAVLVFKGTEPLLSDYTSMLDWMAQAPLRKSTRVMADHFPLAEGKIPGALSLKEALHEARVALHVQSKHLAHYGELADIPTPLLVHALSEERREACVAALRRKLSEAAFERIEPTLQHGLAVYVYYYPSAPVRSNYWGDMGAAQFNRFFDRTRDNDEIITSWVRLIARLLYLGFLPYSVRNEGLGACMDFGNAALNGGFCDPDSILPIDASVDDEFFRESVIQSLVVLQGTVQLMLGLSPPTTLYPTIEEFACRRYLYHLVDKAIETERRPGLHLDERFLQLLSPRSVDDLKVCAARSQRAHGYAQFVKRTGAAHRSDRNIA